MPAYWGKVHHDCPARPNNGLTQEEIEQCIQSAIQAFHNKEAPSLLAAAHQQGIEKKYSTIYRHETGKTMSCSEARAKQQLLTPAQEDALLEWIQFLGVTGRPLSKHTICPYVYDLCGRYLLSKWLMQFLKRHSDIKLRWPSGLDLKRAQAFNYTAVKDFFEMLQVTLIKHDIPWENVYNMDEKGIQLGGGQKSDGWKFFFSCDDCQRYQIKGGSLELVTVIECVCADGTDLLPGFIFSGGIVDEQWTVADPQIM